MKRAFVTGVSSGIGQAVADMLLVDGWQVVGFSRRPPTLLFEHYNHEQFSWIHGDLMRPWASIGKSTWHFEDGLDAVVHCAAEQGPVGPMQRVSQVAWERCIRVNLLGTYYVVDMLLPYLLLREDSRILLMSGGGAFNPRPNYSAYAASKAGVVALADSLAEELRGRVCVNVVAPGMVPTDIHRATIEAGPELAGEQEWKNVQAATEDRAAMIKVLTCIDHLLGPEATGLTGKQISAVHDAWRGITANLVPQINESDLWTRSRVKWLASPLKAVAV